MKTKAVSLFADGFCFLYISGCPSLDAYLKNIDNFSIVIAIVVVIVIGPFE